MVGWKRVGGLVGLLVFFTLAIPLGWSQDQAPKVAVLPFVIHGQQDSARAQKALDEVFLRLMTSEGMKMVDPQEAQRAAGSAVQTEEQARSIAGRLGAAYALFGSYNQIGSSISLDAKLVDVSGKKKTMVLFAEEKGVENIASAAGTIVRQMGVNVLSKALIAEVKVRGNDRIEADAIRGTVKSKKGELLKAETVSEDIRAIFKMGFFEKVDAEVADSPGGKILTFVVQENPSVQEVRIHGQKKIKEKDIQAAIATKPYTVLQRSVVSDDVQKILKLYQQKGYSKAVVNSKIEFPKDPRKAVVAFDITENKKVYIKKILFTGNKNLSGRKLRGVMQTKQKSILSFFTDRGILQREMLDTDVDRVTALYHDEGYMDAKVGSPEVTLKDDGYYVSITVDEGARYKVTSVKLTGDMLDDYEKKIVKKLELKPKLYFSREKVRKDIDLVTKTYMNDGYARVDVDPQIKRNQEDHTTDVTFQVVKKDKVHIGRIFITGNSKTRDYVIRREVVIAEGDLFSARKIEQSLTRLKKLDYFEDVDISPVDTEVKDVMNLQVKVKEKMTGSITLGGGFSSEDGMFISGQIAQKNLFGKGQVISLKGYLGQEAQRYMLSFTEPYIFGYPISAGFDVYNWLRAYEDFTKDAIGFRLRSGFPFGQYSRVSMYYVFERGHVTDISTALAEAVAITGNSVLEWENKSAVGFGVERDTTDHPFLPTRGTYAGFNMELATHALGGDYDFFRHEYHAGVYYPLPIWKFIGHIRGEFGLMHSLLENSNIPLYENFYLGGINSLRGWKFGQVGPKVNDVVIGGDRYAVANVEVLFPIAEKMGIRGVVFFDTGNAWNDGDEIKLRSDVGAGIRWNSPFGPLRVEIGYNLSKEPGDDPYQWQFSAGAFF
ncbi:MAG: outer membrane protein assembly factor BamA [Syntrophobacter sp.]